MIISKREICSVIYIQYEKKKKCLHIIQYFKQIVVNPTIKQTKQLINQSPMTKKLMENPVMIKLVNKDKKKQMKNKKTTFKTIFKVKFILTNIYTQYEKKNVYT